MEKKREKNSKEIGKKHRRNNKNKERRIKKGKKQLSLPKESVLRRLPLRRQINTGETPPTSSGTWLRDLMAAITSGGKKGTGGGGIKRKKEGEKIEHLL